MSLRNDSTYSPIKVASVRSKYRFVDCRDSKGLLEKDEQQKVSYCCSSIFDRTIARGCGSGGMSPLILLMAKGGLLGILLLVAIPEGPELEEDTKKCEETAMMLAQGSLVDV